MKIMTFVYVWYEKQSSSFPNTFKLFLPSKEHNEGLVLCS